VKVRGYQVAGLVFLLAGMVSIANAQRPQGGDEGRVPRKGGEMSVDALLTKYDTDKNGQLSKTELEALVTDMKSRRQGGGAGPGSFGGGMSREEMVKKYDTDGDGKLSEEERKVMFEEMKARRNSSAE
jgi:hypothetical protein